MSKLLNLLLVSAAVAGFAVPAVAASGSNPANDTMACSVSVDYLRSGVVRLSYVKDFEVSPDAPFTDDFSNAIRFRFFDASVVREAGVPVVSVVFDADVDVFNAVDFGAVLKVKDESNGETQVGNNTFFTSVPGAAGSHRTNYSLTCKRAKI
ncbi:MAG: hypothetical protein ABL931_01240 [Usitatibacteraceae bacterium]